MKNGKNQYSKWLLLGREDSGLQKERKKLDLHELMELFVSASCRLQCRLKVPITDRLGS